MLGGSPRKLLLLLPFTANETLSMNHVVINKEPVELYKILKFESIASSGGEAKAFIESGQVQVNGEVETRKRKKITAGDVIECMGQQYTISLAE